MKKKNRKKLYHIKKNFYKEEGFSLEEIDRKK